MIRIDATVAAAAALLCLARPGTARASEPYAVKADVGNSTMTAVFDAPLGERITALTNEVGCTLTWDEKAGMSGTCAIPLTALRVDNDDTKTEHFRQWATNKKVSEKSCELVATLKNVKPAQALQPEKPVPFDAQVPFTVCGKARTDGAPEHVTGTVVLFPKGAYGPPPTLRIRAHVERFDREAYRIGPKWTSGWLARVQGLAKVVAPVGTIDLNLFAAASK